jgi:glycosyltransferase involved in cell wall biosynthesis
MPRLLLVSYEFPPKGGTQSQHVVKFARALVAHGWDVTVLTVDDPPTSLVDERMLEDVARETTVLRAWSLEPTRLIQWLRRRKGSGAGAPAAAVPAPADAAGPSPAAPASPAAAPGANAATPAPTTGARGFTSMPRWAIRLIQAFFVPDEKVGWTRYAVTAAERASAQRPFDAILSIGPPFTAHHIASKLTRRLRVPWVADLSDPLVGGYFFRPVTPLNAWLMRRFETRVVTRAAWIVAATRGIVDDLLARHPEAAGRVGVMPNGFDPADFEGVDRAHTGFVVSYVGTFQGSIRPDAFLDAAVIAMGRSEALAADLRIRFVGPLDPATDEAVAARGLSERVERTGFVPHDAAARAMAASDVLLLVLGPEAESKAIQTSKLPEYLGARRPVLALVPPGGVAADTVTASRAGEVVPSLDAEAAADALLHLYELWRDGRLPQPAEEVVARFDTRRLAGELDELLRRLVAERKAER